MSKRIVITLSNQNHASQEGPWTYFIPITHAYCKSNNFMFECVTLKKNPDDRAFSWAKIPVLAKYYEMYDEVLLINNNSTVLDVSINIFDYLKTAPECTLWKKDGTSKPFIYALCDKASSHGNPLSDILLIDCSNKENVKQFLNDWWNEIPNALFKTATPYENSTFLSWKHNGKKASQFRIADIWSQEHKEENQVFISITESLRNIQNYEAKKYMYRLLKYNKKKVGIFVRQSNYYASGAGQNCIFIKHSLEAAGYDVDLLVDYNPTKPNIVDSQIPYAYVSVASVDLAKYTFILYGSSIPSPDIQTKIRELRIPTAIFHPMNSIDAIHNNHFIYEEPTSVPIFEETFHTVADEIWLTSNHANTYKSMLEIQNKHKIPVRVVPLTWSPLFTLNNGIQYKYNHHEKANTINLIIMEPNMSYWKHALMPLVIAEAFYMKHKEKVNKVYLFGSISKEAEQMINTLSIAKDSKLRKLGRMPINDIIKFFCFTEPNYKLAVLSHNIQCPLNYAYYDVMHANIPFVHNSSVLKSKNIGFHYETLSEGVAKIETIFGSVSKTDYNKFETELNAINPYSEAIVKQFDDLLSAR